MIKMFDQQRIKSVCKHEAGHYLVAKLLGFKTHGISIKVHFPIGHEGGSTIEPSLPGITNIDLLKSHLRKRIQILYAGVISEAFHNENTYDSDYALKEWRTGGGRDDYSKIRELTHILRNISFPSSSNTDEMQSQLTKIDDELINLTGETVSTNLRLISSICDLLLKKVAHYDEHFELSEGEILELPSMRNLFPKETTS
ncbi:hypothetical protein KK060_19850 [Fulvivirgaceae bacterium PWU20]|uniref:Peptidase M41 domain-containing protein n=2 Tax=Chryseosolibacter indicus TaxID=2782351 RepID=A0ABS5VVT5_9BACT|nr:hypothetical protein [Chryseosolibacter indicus]